MTVETKSPPVEKCAHCGAPLRLDAHGHLRYWSEMRSGADGWPVSVKVCPDCRNKWIQGEDDCNERHHGFGHRRHAGASLAGVGK